MALVGRRNVGKSTLLNALYGRRRAITDSYAGLTRDVLEVEIDREGYHFVLCDTPGLDIDNPDQLDGEALARARRFIETVDLILFLLEAPAPAAFDHEFLEFVRRNRESKPVVFAVNKVDGAEMAADALPAFYEAGVPDPIAVSALGRWNLGGLLKRLSETVPALRRTKQQESAAAHSGETDTDEIPEYVDPEQQQDDRSRPAKKHGPHKRDAATRSKRKRLDKSGRELDAPGLHGLEDSTVISDMAETETRIAIVGRPNAGKSSLLNRFAGREVSLVSEIPGTTRDTVDTVFRFKGREIRIIDTAGMRRQSKLLQSPGKVDYYSVTRTRRAIRDARVVIHMIDALAGITDFDKKISATVKEFGRPVVVGVNKWDAVENKDQHTMRDFADRMQFLFPHLRNLPLVFCSAQEGQRVGKLIDISLDLDRRMRTRVPTGALNTQVERWMRSAPGSARNLKVFYVSQVDAEPPVFVFFVNKKKEFRGALIAYFENHIRKTYELEGIPLRIFVREKGAEAV